MGDVPVASHPCLYHLIAHGACQGGLLMILPLYALDFGHGEAMAASVLAARGLGNMLGTYPPGCNRPLGRPPRDADRYCYDVECQLF